tara:strand:+ start:2474 stop:2917 length:444 start_codon:yes stop_codon:yes gene_type:complete
MDFIEENLLISKFEKSCTVNETKDKEVEICGICAEEIKEGDDIDKLRCNHMYHHECIYKWFESIEKKQKVMSTVAHRQCPYCCKQSDYLVLRPNEKAIKHVHKIVQSKSKSNVGLYCCAIKKNGKKCTYKAKYTLENKCYCGIHYDP